MRRLSTTLLGVVLVWLGAQSFGRLNAMHLTPGGERMQILAIAIALVGAGILLWPPIETWFIVLRRGSWMNPPPPPGPGP